MIGCGVGNLAAEGTVIQMKGILFIIFQRHCRVEQVPHWVSPAAANVFPPAKGREFPESTLVGKDFYYYNAQFGLSIISQKWVNFMAFGESSRCPRANPPGEEDLATVGAFCTDLLGKYVFAITSIDF